MKKQDRGYKRISQELEEYIQSLPNKRFDEHGYLSFVKTYNRKIVNNQKFELEIDAYTVCFDTALCQPFLWWDGDVLSIAGVKDYNCSTQIGHFFHETNEGILSIYNVHSYHVYVSAFGKYLPCRDGFIPDANEIGDIYVTAIVKSESRFDLKIYHNTALIFEKENVFECEYISHTERTHQKERRGYVIFAQKQGNDYRNFLCDICTLKIFELDSSKKMPSWYFFDVNCLQSTEKISWFQKYRNRIIQGFEINIIMHLNSSKTSQIICEFIKNADKYVVLENLFEEDTTLNIMVTYFNNKEAVSFLYYCYTKCPEMFGHGIMGLSIDELEVGTQNHLYEYRDVYNYSEYYLKRLKYINKSLYKKCNEKMRVNALPEFIYDNCISSYDMEAFMRHYIRKMPSSFKAEKKKYDEIFQNLASKGVLSIRWKNEYSLYTLVHKKYQDAIYQYHCSWLGNLSLDIYIPSLNLGIEYQGKQHYESVEFFGGKECLIQQMKRDARKKTLCGENGIILMEWRYDEPISPIVLKQKLKELL